MTVLTEQVTCADFRYTTVLSEHVSDTVLSFKTVLTEQVSYTDLSDEKDYSLSHLFANQLDNSIMSNCFIARAFQTLYLLATI